MWLVCVQEQRVDVKINRRASLEEQQYELTSTPRAVSLAAYVAKDGLVGHHWEERPLVFRRSYALVQGNTRARKWEWVGWGAGQREWGGGHRGLSG